MTEQISTPKIKDKESIDKYVTMPDDFKLMNKEVYKTMVCAMRLGLTTIPLTPPDAGMGAEIDGKKPLLWKWQDSTLPYETKIKSWHRTYQDLSEFDIGINVGLICGPVNGIVCIDIDPRNGGLDWYEEHKKCLEGGIHELSGRGDGGRHIYYRARYETDGDVVLRKCKLAPGVDLLASNGSQVVMTPSIHAATGMKYSWEGDRTIFDIAKVSYIEDIDYLWDILKEALVAKRSSYDPSIIVDIVPSKLQTHDKDRLLFELERLDADRGRHNMIGWWIGRALACGMHHEEVEQHAQEWLYSNGRAVGEQPNEVRNWIRDMTITIAEEGIDLPVSLRMDRYLARDERVIEQEEAEQEIVKAIEKGKGSMRFVHSSMGKGFGDRFISYIARDHDVEFEEIARWEDGEYSDIAKPLTPELVRAGGSDDEIDETDDDDDITNEEEFKGKEIVIPASQKKKEVQKVDVYDHEAMKRVVDVTIKESRDITIDNLCQKFAFMHVYENCMAFPRWQDVMHYDSKGYITSDNEVNVANFLLYHPDLAGLIVYDDFSHRFLLTRTPVWEKKGGATSFGRIDDAFSKNDDDLVVDAGRPLTDSDKNRLCVYLRTQHRCKQSNQTVTRALDVIRHHNKINVFHALVTTCHKMWVDDGKKNRIDDFFLTYTECGNVPKEYLREAGRVTWLGFVNRALRPGAKNDIVPVFEGSQGVHKSKFIRAMGWMFSSEGLGDIRDKDSKLCLFGKTIAEISEGVGLDRYGSEMNKSFLTTLIDTMRLPYETTARDFKRTCSFIMSTNNDHYLRDKTDNRRYLPIPIVKAYDDLLIRDRALLYGEVYERLLNGEKPYTTDSDLLDMQKAVQRSRLAVDPIESEVLSAVDGKTRISSAQLAMNVFGRNVADLSRGDHHRLEDTMTINGYEKKIRLVKDSSGKRHRTTVYELVNTNRMHHAELTEDDIVLDEKLRVIDESQEDNEEVDVDDTDKRDPSLPDPYGGDL